MPKNRGVVDIIDTAKDFFGLKVSSGRFGINRDAQDNFKNKAFHEHLVFICSANHFKRPLVELEKSLGLPEKNEKNRWRKKKFTTTLGEERNRNGIL